MSFLSGKHLVIFGCGYVGSALAVAAQARGAKVTALTRNEARATELRAAGFDVVVGELADERWHDLIPTGPDWVANTVSAASPNPEGYRRSYVEGMRSILAWAARGSRPIGTFLYTSSTGVYPQGGGARVDELSPTEPPSPTGAILVEAENLLRATPAEAVTRWFILRLAGIYGPGRHHHLDALRAGTTNLKGSPQFRMNLAHRDDIVSALLACAEAPPQVANEVFNLSDNAPATRTDLIGWLANELGLPAPQFAGASGDGQSAAGSAPDRVICSEKIRARLGWRPAYPDFRAGYAPLLAAARGDRL